MPIIRLDQQRRRVKVAEFELDNEVVFLFLDGKSEESRDDLFTRAIYIGVLALMEDRLAAFLAKTQNELGTELEHLKLIFDLKKQLFYQSTQKGAVAEDEIAAVIREYTTARAWKDRVELTGATAGVLPRNKTGDIVCHLDGEDDRRLVIECKFDKSLKLGEIDHKDVFKNRSDTAWSQLLEAQANREGRVSIIVFDANLVDASLAREVDSLSYVPGVGFIAIVDSLKGDYRSLLIAYSLARQIALAAQTVKHDDKLMALLVRRIIQSVSTCLKVRSLVEQNIETNQEILRQLNKSLLLMEFTQKYFQRFLDNGTLTPGDLLDFYQGEEIKEQFKAVEKDIEKLGKENK